MVILAAAHCSSALYNMSSHNNSHNNHNLFTVFDVWLLMGSSHIELTDSRASHIQNRCAAEKNMNDVSLLKLCNAL